MLKLSYPYTALAGTTLCLLAVAIGAFGSHALSGLLIENQRESTFELANRYHFYHGLALIAIAALFQTVKNNRLITLASAMMFLGVLVFSGSLYLLALSDTRWLGAITPIGGVLLITAWALLAWQIYRQTSASPE